MTEHDEADTAPAMLLARTEHDRASGETVIWLGDVVVPDGPRRASMTIRLGVDGVAEVVTYHVAEHARRRELLVRLVRSVVDEAIARGCTEFAVPAPPAELVAALHDSGLTPGERSTWSVSE